MSLEVKELIAKSKKQYYELQSKKNKTIKDYLDLELLKADAYIEEFSEYNLNKLFPVEEYYDNTKDNTVLTESEFFALVTYTNNSSRQEYEIKRFIDDLKKVNIENEFEIGYEIALLYDPIYFNNTEDLITIEASINNCKNKKGEEYSNNILGLIEFLTKKKEEASEYKKTQIEKIENILNLYTNAISNDFLYIIYYLLDYYNYDIELVIKNLPSEELVNKDLSTSYLFSNEPKVVYLYREYMTNDKELKNIPDDLGYYNKPNLSMRVPFTKQEFLDSITDYSEYIQKGRTYKKVQ